MPNTSLYDPEVLRQLLADTQRRAMIQPWDRNLQNASARGSCEEARNALLCGADVDCRCNGGWTPLILASSNSHFDVVVLLLEAHASVHKQTNDGWTALMYAVHNNNSNIMRIVLEREPDLQHSTKTNGGWSALMFAAYLGHREAVDMLLSAGIPARVAFVCPGGDDAFDCALRCNGTDLSILVTLVAHFHVQERAPIVEILMTTQSIPVDLAVLIATFLVLFK